MKTVATILALYAVIGMAQATDFCTLGPTSEPGEIIGSGLDECTGTLIYNHDNTFEGAFAWNYGGVQPPYYGAFGEGFAMGGDANVQCISLFLSHVGQYFGQTCDVYIWEGGVTSPPDAVLMVMTGFNPGTPATWPSVSQHDADIPDCAFSGDALTVGYWGNWPGQGVGWYVAGDHNGPGGHPWTNLAPGSGYGTGWADPSIVWGGVMSLGLGLYYGEPTPARSATWGVVKALFE